MLERGPIEPRQGERLVPGRLLAGIDVDVGERRLPRLGQLAGPGVDLEAGLVAEPGQAGRLGRRGGGRWRRDRSGRRRRSRASGSATSGRSPGCSSARTRARRRRSGKRWRLSGRSLEVRQHRRRDRREVADELALGDRRRRRAAASNSGLSRFVSLSSWPPICQTPSLPRASSAASSSVAPAERRNGRRSTDLRLRRRLASRHRRSASDGRRFGGFGGTDRGGRGDRGLADDGLRVTARLDALVGRLADADRRASSRRSRHG